MAEVPATLPFYVAASTSRRRPRRSQESPPSAAPGGGGSRAPLGRLALGLTLSLLTIIGFCLYAAHEIGRLRDEQMALSERNRRDSLQLIRVQNNLSTLAITLRDMTDRTEPYPMAAWASTFDRLELDLQQALELERSLAPARPPGQQQQIADITERFWAAVDRALALAGRGDEAAAIEAVRTDALPRHAELVSLVSQLLVRNTQVEEASAAAARDVYTRVVRQILLADGDSRRRRRGRPACSTSPRRAARSRKSARSPASCARSRGAC